MKKNLSVSLLFLIVHQHKIEIQIHKRNWMLIMTKVKCPVEYINSHFSDLEIFAYKINGRCTYRRRLKYQRHTRKKTVASSSSSSNARNKRALCI